MTNVYFHGECVIKENLGEIPTGCTLIKPDNNRYIIAKSETTFNHHVLEAKDGVEVYEKKGVLYMKNKIPCDVYCVVKNRHDNITLNPGVWTFERANEFDYLTQMKRRVAD